MKRLAAVIAILALCSNVYGTLIELDNAPTWRGDEGSTYQAWEFNAFPNDQTAIAPDDIQNDFGGATLGVTAEAVLQPIYQNRLGVWRVNSLGNMHIDIQNTDNTGLDTWKEIWLQIIYKDPGGVGSDVSIVTDPLFAFTPGALQRMDRDPLADGYFLDTYKIILEPNPPEERIELRSIQENVYISAVAVDTKCIPEPASICLLGLGVLGLLRKRRA